MRIVVLRTAAVKQPDRFRRRNRQQFFEEVIGGNSDLIHELNLNTAPGLFLE